ncbi:MAG: hypothetical protein LBN27_01545 [Prevotellaceae bacterium]|jgi:hypothetical protein|nr:hypothetical protein [Prevotellaceae bacterium]
MKMKDSFWWGLAPALIIPFVIVMCVIMHNTEQDILSVVGKLPIIIRNSGISRLMISILPNLLLLFVFYVLQKDKAARGAFVGTVPYILVLFWVF